MVNAVSLEVANLIYEYAGTYRAREDYGSLEQLAQVVQRTIVQSFCERLAHGNFKR